MAIVGNMPVLHLGIEETIDSVWVSLKSAKEIKNSPNWRFPCRTHLRVSHHPRMELTFSREFCYDPNWVLVELGGFR
jgi:hypothetical protein